MKVTTGQIVRIAGTQAHGTVVAVRGKEAEVFFKATRQLVTHKRVNLRPGT